ncbi:MAG: hypothetical protein PVH88_01125 [Ignavibacteria bacterium]|jgi:hypothetical protein
MNLYKKLILGAFLLFTFLRLNLFAGDLKHRGQVSLWTRPINTLNEWRLNLGLRFFPEITFKQYLNSEMFFDAELSLNGFLQTDFDNSDKDLKLYRLKLRFATAQSETRIGLQQLNFGPAQILRSLMWFDKIDPRDPLNMTDGVYGIRYRYSFLNNSGIWLWGLYGNESTKGYEVYSTAKKKPEFGGRYQFPVPDGEMAATFHTREVNAGNFEYRENRFALDGRWDIEIGFWFESVFQHSNSDLLPYKWQKNLTLGADYTFGIGSGLYTVIEHMGVFASNKILGNDSDSEISAFMLSYPVGMFDNLSAIGYYSWNQKKFYQYTQWQRSYDSFLINIGAFYYPSGGSTSISQNENIPLSGYGLQVMFIYNY